MLKSDVAADRVKAMPMIQVVALDSYRTFEVQRDELSKWSYLPFWLGAQGVKASQERMSSTSTGFPFVELIPATRSASMAVARLQRRIAALQVLEGLRLFADTHQGALPARLDELTDTPAPIDPITGRSFEYRLEGDHAVLTGPAAAGFEGVSKVAIRYEFRKAR